MAARDEAARDHHGFLRPGARRLGCRRAPRMPGIAARTCSQAPRDVAPRTSTTWPTARLRHALEHVCNAVYSTSTTWPPARLRQGLSHVHGLPSRTSAGRPRARPCYWSRARLGHGLALNSGTAPRTSMAWLRARPRLGPVRAHCNAQLADYCIGRARGRVITTGIAHGFAHVRCSAPGTGERLAQSAARGMMTAIAHGLAPVYCGARRGRHRPPRRTRHPRAT